LHGIKITKNNSFIIVYTENPSQYQNWHSQLIFKGILITFHQDFEVKKLIGVGGNAKVYLGTKKESSKQFAVKAFIKEKIVKTKNGVESIMNEIKIMRMCDSPHILKLFEVYESVHSIYFIIEVLQGGNIKQW